MDSLRIIPVGEEVRIALLDELAAKLAARFRVSCHVETAPLEAGFAWDKHRNQYFSTALLKRLLERSPGWVLGITALDLFVPVLTFVFGEAQLGGRAAVASVHRLAEEFYGLPPNEELLFDRLLKEAVHELGHTSGLRHCDDWRCVMTSSHAVERIDIKSAEFCPACAAALAFPAVIT